MKINKKSILLCLIMVIGLGIAFEGGAAQKQLPKNRSPKEQPKMGGTLVFGVGKEFNTPNPFIGTQGFFQAVKETAYESLLTYDDDGRIVPNLAEAYEVTAGGTVFMLRLRKGVTFHNGKEMKADDVIWSANHVKDPVNGAFGQKLINNVKSVEKIDDYTIKFTLENPSGVFIPLLSAINMLPVVPANSLQPGQLKLEQNTFVPGTGPFSFDQFQPGFDMIVKKFPGYWRGPAYLDKIIFRPITDDANRFNALRTGDVQLADRLFQLDADRVKKGQIKGITLWEDPLGGYVHIFFNHGNPLFQKIEMRQALTFAVDKQRLVDEVSFGAGQPTDLMMDPKSIWAKTAGLPRHKRDLAKAKALLKAAGYNGQELVLIGRKQEVKFLESYQMIMAEAGIKIRLELLEAGVYKDRYRAGKYDLCPAGGTIVEDPVLTMIEHNYTTKVEKGRYSNPKVDKLFDNLVSEYDQKKRLEIFKDLAWTLHNDVATIPLYFESRYHGVVDKVQGYGPPQGRSYKQSGRYFRNVWLK